MSERSISVIEAQYTAKQADGAGGRRWVRSGGCQLVSFGSPTIFSAAGDRDRLFAAFGQGGYSGITCCTLALLSCMPEKGGKGCGGVEAPAPPVRATPIPASVKEVLKNPQDSWNEELLEKYGQLQLPSLYDYLLTQEKLAVEIRRQNKELQATRENLLQMHNSVVEIKEWIESNAASQQEELEALQQQQQYWSDEGEGSDDEVGELQEVREQVSLERAELQQVFMQTMDAVLNLLEATMGTSEQINKLVPEGRSLWNPLKPAWRHQLESTLSGYEEGVLLIKDKLLTALSDADIEVIIPEIDGPFNPQLHRAIEKVQGGRKSTIAKVIRYGYCKGEEVLRSADVVLYH